MFATRVGLGVGMRVGWCGYGGLWVQVCLLSVLWQEVVVVRCCIVYQRAWAAFKSTLDAGLLVLWVAW